jgi:hypothetical protein
MRDVFPRGARLPKNKKKKVLRSTTKRSKIVEMGHHRPWLVPNFVAHGMVMLILPLSPSIATRYETSLAMALDTAWCSQRQTSSQSGLDPGGT